MDEAVKNNPVVAAQLIATSLERLIVLACDNDLPMLAYLLEMAHFEAKGHRNAGDDAEEIGISI